MEGVFRALYVPLYHLTLIQDLGLDGLDIDYEYPTNKYQANGYVTLLKELREALDLHAQTKGNGYRYLLTVSSVHSDCELSIEVLADCGSLWSG